MNFKSDDELGINNGYSDYWEVEHAVPEVADGSYYFMAPELFECSLADCPVGLFEHNGVLGMKTKYMTKVDKDKYRIDAYIVSTGECFGISNDTPVRPCSVWIAEDSYGGI
jgi:hypothetical protein